ncbi:helix-turn-helix transcriptional regulator (plasmid) [Moritella sp. 24]|uniref:helix-turn-helix domain-containing protein n=1 Tax=Moritella sp. 24 TaxID=2746230 RepID=UPI001BACD285|nr:helix-turn-helix transcriptional regulator [Moritella sp. 24]QUM78828.1 helix-turn-helix transcriptional regulator [Moritella sp. 24]
MIDIKLRLKNLKMNQVDFAAKCGVSGVQVSKWVNGHAEVPIYAQNILNLIEKIGRDQLLDKLTNLANILTDGHYTICKFTTNYRVGLGTPADRDFIDKMAEGKTLNEAISNLLNKITTVA